MSTESHPFPERPLDLFGNLPTGLGPPQATFRTSADLAALLARFPADTPVVLADSVRKAEQLDINSQPHHTVSVAGLVLVVDPDAIAAVEAGHDIDEYQAYRLAVQLGAVVVADGAPCLPFLTVPLSAYERAVEALIDADTTTAVKAQVDLLQWMADTLITEPGDDSPNQPGHEDNREDEFDFAARTVADWINDPALTAALRVEAGRLRHTAHRLAVLAARIADHEAVAEIIAIAEEVIEVAAEHPDPEDDRPT